MSVKTNLTDKPLVDYSFTVDIPPLNPAELGGSTGSISITTEPLSDSQFLRGNEFSLTDSRFGSAFGIVGGVDSNDESTSITGESNLRKFTDNLSIPPKYLVSTSECMNSVLSLVGFRSSGLSTDNLDVFPGWRGSLFDYIKHFCSARGLEYYSDLDAPNTLVFRPVGQKELDLAGAASFSHTISDQSLAQAVEVVVRDYVTPSSIFANIEFTPAYADGESQILTVDPGKTVEYEIKINGWARTVNQPQAVDYVGPEEQTGLGSYCVAGNDGLPVSAMQWNAQGGKLRVEIGEDPGVLKVVLTAPNRAYLPSPDGTADRYGPYSIAATSVLDNTFYNSLHITGAGVCTRNSTITCPTGVNSGISVTRSSYWSLSGSSVSEGVCTDRAGDIYVCDAYTGLQRVRKYSPSGTLLLSVPSASPGDIDVDFDGNLYVTDTTSNLVRKYDSTGTAITSWSTVGGADGIAVDSLGNTYVTDSAGGIVRKFGPSGASITSWSTPYPKGVAIDSYDNVYVTDRTNRLIRKFNPVGTEINRWSTTDRPYYICIAADTVYVYTYGVEDWGDLRCYTSSGVQIFTDTWTDLVTGVSSIAAYSADRLYAVYYDRVYTYTLAGGIATAEAVGTTVDNPFVSNESIGWDVAVAAAKAFGGATHTFSASVVPSGAEISDTLGALFTKGVFRFRVESATVFPGGVSVSGNTRETLADFDTLWVGKTIGDFDTVWSGKTFNDQASAPLWVG